MSSRCYQELRGLQCGRAIEIDHLVVCALQRSLCGCPVVADDVVDQRVIEQIELFKRIHQPPNMVIGILQEPGVNLHLPDEHRLECGWHLIPRRDFFVPLRELTILRNDAQLFLPGEGLFAQLVPTLVELAFVLVRPFLRNVVRSVSRARREVDEERLIGNERLLLPNPVDGLVRHVFHQVVALFGRLLDLDRYGAFIERWIPLVRLAADEPVEIFESASAGRPSIKGTGRTGLPDRHFMTLAELRRRIPIELEGPGEWRAGVRQNRVIAGRPGGDLGDPAHADRVVVASGQHGLSRRRAQRCGVKAVEFQAARRQQFRRRRVAWTAEGA